MIKTTAMLLDELCEYSRPRLKLSRMARSGEVAQIIRGLYETDRSVPNYCIAGSNYGPSYISFEYALSYYGLIPEAVYAVTSAAFKKKKAKTYCTPFGTFHYCDVPPKAFPLGLKVVHEGEYYYRIASPEKALCDKLYSVSPVANLSELTTAIEQMLHGYNVGSIYDKKNAMKEIIQEIVLCGLYRAGFFKKAAFYGSTALRIFYGLDRFSEDLDFSLETNDGDFDFSSYFQVLEREVNSFGLNVTTQEITKTHDNNIRSAFLKRSTSEHLLLFYADPEIAKKTASNEAVKIKLEIDVNPPRYATLEHKYRLLPTPYEVTLYDLPSLFAGKLHAVICRSWQNRVKGRDLYDYVFYLRQKAAVNLPHLNERLRDSGYIDIDAKPTLEDIKDILCSKFDSIDFTKAKEDARPFIRDASVLEIWSADFFKQITATLQEAKQAE
ncbi:nucleotidyl transferase AbiEii/AbiGii toxin family protein [uncultured Cloacibacillus sp.]|uniref:nucleotidyl transferase AbiEii/AbiGii toxin family protein n=1 Tax=uncultured Cloacibacillus sp. TaxID=889794 RepID=UPI0026DB9153|nr:nucleotidyl transferase AbiEii/AbiGii toxin family protein [uncultured Cloacibacillus sp.]